MTQTALFALALLAAERHRLRTGAGQLAELSLKDVAAAMMGNLGIIGEVAVNGVDRAKAGNALYGAYGQDFVLACGQRVMVIGLTDRQWRGLVKVLGCAESGRILGAHIIGPMAGDLIHEVCVAMEFGASAQDLALTCHAHPTWSEAVREAALACGDGAIHA